MKGHVALVSINAHEPARCSLVFAAPIPRPPGRDTHPLPPTADAAQGRLLRSECKLSEYGISSGDVVHLVTRPTASPASAVTGSAQGLPSATTASAVPAPAQAAASVTHPLGGTATIQVGGDQLIGQIISNLLRNSLGGAAAGVGAGLGGGGGGGGGGIVVGPGGVVPAHGGGGDEHLPSLEHVAQSLVTLETVMSAHPELAPSPSSLSSSSSSSATVAAWRGWDEERRQRRRRKKKREEKLKKSGV